MNVKRPKVLPIMALGILALFAALWGGLARMGWAIPATPTTIVALHGPLMIAGFLGTLVSLERAVVHHLPGALLVPISSGIGTVVILTGLAFPVGQALITLSSLGLVILSTTTFLQHRTLYTLIGAFGAGAFLIGNINWLFGAAIPEVVFWWMGFLVLTIVGERLELSRLLRHSVAVRAAFLVIVAVFLSGMVVRSIAPDVGSRLAGLGMLGLAIWLLQYDIARRTVRRTGLTRFVAIALLSGFCWLGVGGGLAMAFGSVSGGQAYDSILHAVFLGFVMSMIFGHAPIILPALGRPLTYHPRFYSHLALLHLTLLLRVGGDLSGSLAIQQWGGLLNTIVVLLFATNTVLATRPSAKSAHLKVETRST